MEELLSLKWNNHRSTFLQILTVLRDKQLYTDATLACDGKFYSVHRLVLSTCSDYFSAMFDRTTECKNPIIVLKDIKCEDLEALLDYMYLGEVNVRQADLAPLIKAAECLRVKGLAVPDDEPPAKKAKSDTSNVRRSDGAASPPTKRKRRDESHRPQSPAQNQSRLSPPPAKNDASSSPASAPQPLLRHQDEAPEPADSVVSVTDGIVKVEADEPIDEGGGFDPCAGSFKSEIDPDPNDDMNSDLPEFLHSNDDSYSQPFPGTSYQSDLQNWQGDPNLAGGPDFSGLGFPPSSQDGAQNTSGDPRFPTVSAPYTHLLRTESDRDHRLNTRILSHGRNRDGTTHSDLEHSICHICGKRFHGLKKNRLYNLKAHLKVHAGKEVRCHGCNIAFSTKGNLTVHLKNGSCRRYNYNSC